jgi:hypothetical protein
MYFSSRSHHGSVACVLNEQKKNYLIKESDSSKLIVNGNEISIFDRKSDFFIESLLISHDSKTLCLSEDEKSYNVINEGIGSLFKSAMNGLRWMWGNIKDKWKGKLPDGAILKAAKEYRDNPKKSLLNLQKEFQKNNPQAKPEEIQQLVSAAKKDMDQIISSRTSLKSAYNDARSGNNEQKRAAINIIRAHSNAAAQAFQAEKEARDRGEDPRQASKIIFQQVYGGGVPGAQPKTDKELSKPDQAQTPAEKAEPIKDQGFTEGEKAHMFDPKTGSVTEGDVVKPDQTMIDQLTKAGMPIPQLVIDVKGKKQAITQQWKPGPAPTQPPVADQNSQQPAQQQPAPAQQVPLPLDRRNPDGSPIVSSMTNRKSISESKKMKNYNPSVQSVIAEMLSKPDQELIDEGFLGNLGQGIKQAAGGLVKGAKAVGQGVKQGVQTARGVDPKKGPAVPQNQRLPGMMYNQQGQQMPQDVAARISAANPQAPEQWLAGQAAAQKPAQQPAAPVQKAPPVDPSIPSDEDAQARFAQVGLQWDPSMSGKSFQELGKIMKQQQAQKDGPNNAQSPQPAQQPTQPAPQQAQAPVQQESVSDMSLKEYQIYWEKQSKKAKK